MTLHLLHLLDLKDVYALSRFRQLLVFSSFLGLRWLQIGPKWSPKTSKMVGPADHFFNTCPWWHRDGSQDVILELPRALLRLFCRHLEVLRSHFGRLNGPLGCPDGHQDVILELPRALWRPCCRHFWIHGVILVPSRAVLRAFWVSLPP